MYIHEKQKGFTMVELMVAMAITATLATLVVGGILIARNTAIETARRSDAKTLQSALLAHYSKNRKFIKGGWHATYQCNGEGEVCEDTPYGSSGLNKKLVDEGYLPADFFRAARQGKTQGLYCGFDNSYILWIGNGDNVGGGWGWGTDSACSGTMPDGWTDYSSETGVN